MRPVLRRYLAKRPLVILLIASALFWGFIGVADEVLEGETEAFDRWLLLALRSPGDPADPVGPGWIEEMGRDFTALGGVGVLTLLVLSAFGYLWLKAKPQAAWFLLGAVTSGILLSRLLKIGFDRPRPDLVPHGSIVSTASFPSGHSLMAALVYLTLGVLVARTSERWAVRSYIVLLAILVTMLVGISRVYLGVHWPTDVLAGWMAGAGWALLCLTVAQWLETRR